MRNHLPAHGRIRLLNVAEVVRSAQAGDRAAFGVLYERFGGYVYAILLAHLPRQDAADCVQDVFMVALERLGSLREPAAFPGWIAAIARRRAVDAFRSEAASPMTRVMDQMPDVPGRTASPHDRAEAAQVLRVIQQLPEQPRLVRGGHGRHGSLEGKGRARVGDRCGSISYERGLRPACQYLQRWADAQLAVSASVRSESCGAWRGKIGP